MPGYNNGVAWVHHGRDPSQLRIHSLDQHDTLDQLLNSQPSETRAGLSNGVLSHQASSTVTGIVCPSHPPDINQSPWAERLEIQSPSIHDKPMQDDQTFETDRP